MKRILVIGCSGSGKSTLAKKLGSRLKLPVHHLDQHFWDPGWVENKPKLLGWLPGAVSKERWILEGLYISTLSQILKRVDTVIFLDYPRWHNLWWTLKRIAGSYGQQRPDMAEGCREQFDPEFFQWIWNFNWRQRPKIVELLKALPRKKVTLMWLKKPRELESWLKSS